MKPNACILLLTMVACQIDKPYKEVNPQQGYSVIFSGTPSKARYTESTPFGPIDWFVAGQSPQARFSRTCVVEVGTLPAGDSGGTNRQEILDTLKDWISKRYPGQISELEGDRGPGFEYSTRGHSLFGRGIIILRNGRLYHAKATGPSYDDPQIVNFLQSFQVDPE